MYNDPTEPIGYCHGEDFCMDCGKKICFNAIYPEVRCAECQDREKAK